MTFIASGVEVRKGPRVICRADNSAWAEKIAAALNVPDLIETSVEHARIPDPIKEGFRSFARDIRLGVV